MKKFILPLLLILSISLLIAAESEASDVVGYVKYSTEVGFNFVAVAMDVAPGSTAEGIFSTYNPDITSIFKFNPVTQSWNSISYDPVDGWIGTMPVTAGDAVLIECSSTFDYYSMGDLPAPISYDIEVGYNAIQIPLHRSDIEVAQTAGTEIGNVSSIFQFDPTTQSWSSISYDPVDGWIGTMPVSIGDVILAEAGAETTWPAAPPTRNSSNSRK